MPMVDKIVIVQDFEQAWSPHELEHIEYILRQCLGFHTNVPIKAIQFLWGEDVVKG